MVCFLIVDCGLALFGWSCFVEFGLVLVADLIGGCLWFVIWWLLVVCLLLVVVRVLLVVGCGVCLDLRLTVLGLYCFTDC